MIEFVGRPCWFLKVKDVTRRLAGPQVGNPLLVWPQIRTRARNGVEKNYERGLEPPAGVGRKLAMDQDAMHEAGPLVANVQKQKKKRVWWSSGGW